MNPRSGQAEVVIDTNVVLDWLVFGDPAVARLAAALQAGRLQWIATQAMLDELSVVLRRPLLLRRPPPVSGSVDTAVTRWCRVVEAPSLLAPALICSDGDDQKFIDLALARPAAWLVSRDKALLRLARRARTRGVAVCLPADWSEAVGSDLAAFTRHDHE